MAVTATVDCDLESNLYQFYYIYDCFITRRLDVLNKSSSLKLKRSPAKKNVRCLIALIYVMSVVVGFLV